MYFLVIYLQLCIRIQFWGFFCVFTIPAMVPVELITGAKRVQKAFLYNYTAID
jgi:hypothetical protein